MSRIGKLPVAVPSGVTVDFSNGLIAVSGPKGKLEEPYYGRVSFAKEGASIVVQRADDEKQSKAFHGLYRKLLANMVHGVTAGWTRVLQITGVGYRAEVQGNLLVMNLGYSQEIYVGIPKDLKVQADANGKVEISGSDKQRVGEFAAQIRKLRAPEPYKGKGIRYDNEKIRRKAGKSGVK